MSVEVKAFGTKDGKEASLYVIANKNGMKAEVTDFGANLVSLWVPAADGELRDVVQGFDSVDGYAKNPSFFGSTVGPNANRIANASFTIDGVAYPLDVNDGTSNLHSHRELGYHKRMWSAACGEDCVVFTLQDEDGSMGYPGNKEFTVTYTVTEENELKITYHAASDKKTVINPTNHAYFNLDGHGKGTILDHELWLNASHYTPVIAGAIPTGEIAAVAGTPMDFTTPKKVGRDIDTDWEQLNLTGGYDHNWVLDDWDNTLRHFATLKSTDGKVTMKAYTTLPGVQFYAGNYIAMENAPGCGKGGITYGKRYAMCLETQYFPNTPNEPAFPQCFFGAGKDYDSVTVYSFA